MLPSARCVLGVRVLLAGAVLSVVTFADLTAGEVQGRVVQRVVKASFGAPGGLGAMDSLREARAPEGPVLVYVGETTGQLPQRQTAGARVRITRGGMTPTLQAISIGSAVDFENADSEAHRIVGNSEHGDFDLGWQAGGTHTAHTFKAVGKFTIRCALTDKTLGELIVLPHSAFALTDASGAFTIADLPAGRATVVAYSSRYGEVSRQIVIPESNSVTLDLSF